MIQTYKDAVPRAATQRERARADQVENSAGGYVWSADDWKRLDRFLILGTAGGSYYAGERELTRENAAVVERLAKDDETGVRVVARVVEISDAGRAPKNDPAVFALAVCLKLGGPRTRAAAKAAVSKVCRIGTHVFQLAECVDALGGWGRGTRVAFRGWYAEKIARDRLALQLVKYANREGWTHRDLLRKIHAPHHPLLAYAAGKLRDASVHPLVDAAHRLSEATSPREAARLIRDHRLPRECAPTALLDAPEVWDALLEDMPLTAMVRNLGKMSAIEFLKPLSDASRRVVAAFRDDDALRKARVHPLALLVAERVYASGHGTKGKLSWTPVQAVVDALDEAFYASFKYVEPTGKRHLLALDVSGSMDDGSVAGSPLTPKEAAGALALVTAASEKDYQIVGFSSGAPGEWTYGSGRSQHYGYRAGLVPIDISPRDRLTTVVDKMSAIPMGGTDCAIPMLYAAERKLGVDVFAVYTDSETWAGNVQPAEALRQYRQQSGIAAKEVVVSMVANPFTIADPADPLMLDVVGFDANTPAAIAEFIRE